MHLFMTSINLHLVCAEYLTRTALVNQNQQIKIDNHNQLDVTITEQTLRYVTDSADQ
jgi:hypothetical protein